MDKDGRLLRQEQTIAEVFATKPGKTIELASSIEKLEAQELFFNALTGAFQIDPVLLGAYNINILAPD